MSTAGLWEKFDKAGTMGYNVTEVISDDKGFEYRYYRRRRRSYGDFCYRSGLENCGGADPDGLRRRIPVAAETQKKSVKPFPVKNRGGFLFLLLKMFQIV